jgi:hypothetical protein
MDLVGNMGMYRDMIQRKSLARIDDTKRRSRIRSAREAIYLKNAPVDGTAVETLLKEDSLVPTAVSVLCHVVGPVFIISERVFGQIINL